MKERKLTVSIAWANIFSVLLLFAVCIPVNFIWIKLYGYELKNFISADEIANNSLFLLKSALFLIALFGGIAVHELIHGITWGCYAKNGWKSISFGIIWKMLTPYCHCDEPLSVRHYIIGALMPLVALGILPLLAGLCLCSILLVVYGVIFIVAAAGDILIAWKLRNENRNNTVLDHPSEVGCIIYEDQD